MFRPVSCKPRENAFDEASNFEINRDQFRFQPARTLCSHPGKILIDDRRLTRRARKEERIKTRIRSTRIEISFRSTNSRSLYREKKRTLNLRVRYNARFRSARSRNHWNLFHQRRAGFARNSRIDFHFFTALWTNVSMGQFALRSFASSFFPFCPWHIVHAGHATTRWLVISLQVTSNGGECTRIFSAFLGLLY